MASNSSWSRADPIGRRASRRSAHRAANATSSRYLKDVSRRTAARICKGDAPFAASNRSICAVVRSRRASARTASCSHRSGDDAALIVTRLLKVRGSGFEVPKPSNLGPRTAFPCLFFRPRPCAVAALRVSPQSFYRLSPARQGASQVNAPAGRPNHEAFFQFHAPTADYAQENL